MRNASSTPCAASARVVRAALAPLVAFALAACAADPPVEPVCVPAVPLTPDAVQMQIVAHEDDDFLFMNPDLANRIHAGLPIVTIYMTAGEANGAGACAKRRGMREIARAEHAHDRQRGVRAAYAQMADPALTPAEADDAAWTRALITPDGVHTVERYTLDAAPQVQLVFMDLREDGETDPGGPSIVKLFADPTLTTTTIVPSCNPHGSCLTTPACAPDMPAQTYARGDVLAVLAALVDAYQPAVIRTLDPEPFAQIGRGANVCPGKFHWDVCFDNPDHTAAARFVDEVVAGYRGPHRSARVTVLHYKGYSFINYPANLGVDAYRDKRAAGEAYRLSRPGDPYYKDRIYEPYYRAIAERYPGGTQWLARARDGRLVAVTVAGRQVQVWREDTIGGSWTGPTTLTAEAPIAPRLTLLTNPGGRLQIFATELPLGLEQVPAQPGAQDVITAVEDADGGFGRWQHLGAPDGWATTGVATAAVDGHGRAFVFARNSQGVPAFTFALDAGWAPWALVDADAGDILDGIAAAAGSDGALDVFWTRRDGQIERHRQTGTSFARAPAGAFDVSDAASPPTVVAHGDGTLEVFYREATSAGYGRVLATRATPDDTWSAPTAVFGDGGGGPIAALVRPDDDALALVARNACDGVSVTRQPATGDLAPQWEHRGGMFDEAPAVAIDGAGRLVVIAQDVGGALYFEREASPGGALGPWTPVGP
jgi:hypothetical protein